MTPRAIRVGASSIVAGVLLTVLFTVTHPSRVDPADSPAVFIEYAESEAWLTVHLGQLVGTLLVLAGFVLFFRQVSDDPHLRTIARSGVVAALVTVVVITILQAVDGVSLKRMVDLYVEGGAEPGSAAFLAAEAVRWVEVGINSVFRLLLGVTMLLAGLVIAMDTIYPRWFGWLGVGLAIIAWIVRGIIVWYTGFANLGIVALPSPFAALWLIALGFLMWRNASPERA